MIRRALLVAALGCAPLTANPASAESQAPEPKPYGLSRDFDGKTKKGEIQPAYDISGMACRPAGADGVRACVVVNDENSGAQFVSLSGTTLSPGATAFDLGKAPSAAIRGAAPPPDAVTGCSGGAGKFNQLDGEAVAYAEPYFYVTGSHGCTRGKRKYELSAMILTRVQPNTAGTAATETVSTYRVFDALKAAGPVADYVLRDLEFDRDAPPPAGTPEPNGLNIEGLAVVGEQLYLGLRAPNLGDKAYLIAVPLEPLFAEGQAPLTQDATAKVKPIPLDLGKDAGIRDLAALPDGRLLVLAGSARNGLKVPYTLFIVDPASGKLTSLGPLEPVKGADADGKTIKGKAEAAVRLGPGRLLVLFDSLLNGAPHEYAVPIP